MPSFLSPLLKADASTRRHVLVDGTSGAVVADTLLTAFTSEDRNKGLLGRSSLADGSAMIIAPCTAVHTFFMQFPIDIAFVARSGKVRKVRHTVRPWRLAAAFGAFAVIELPAGTLQRIGTAVGNTLAVQPASDDQPVSI